MRYSAALHARRHSILQCAAILAAILFLGPAAPAQDPSAPPQSARPPLQEFLDKHPGFLEELGQLFEKLGNNVQFPAARSESRLLPLLPASTVSYAALPNYGNTANQALVTFREALKDSPALRAWWQGEMATTGPKLESFFEKFSQLHQYIGTEIVVSAAIEGGPPPRLLALAEIQKPGLREFLSQMVQELAGSSKPSVLVFDPEELAAAKEEGSSSQFLVLVRSDFVAAAMDLATLRHFSARQDAANREFASTAFGQRTLQEYQGGLTLLATVDLQALINLIPPRERQDPTFQRTGFADLQYLVWGHKNVAGKTITQSELSFIAPRHGIAAWLEKSGPLGSLDFASPKAMLAGSALLKDPALIFEELKGLVTLSDPSAFATLGQLEQAWQLSLKDDLLSYLSGEITVELVSVLPPPPTWKVILGVKDAERLQQTLSTLLAAASLPVESKAEGDVTYYTVRIPRPQAALEVGYAIVDGYLLVGSSLDAVSGAVRIHQSGESLVRSKRFLASLPPGHSEGASALLYWDPLVVAMLQMQRVAPEIAQSLMLGSEGLPAAVLCFDGQETAIRQSTNIPAYDVSVVLIAAAIAIPNLLRARITANETSAVGSLRSANTAQMVYSSTNPERGFAPNLATLGPGEGGAGPASADHADLLDKSLAGSSCTGDTWCEKSGYRFHLAGVCKQRRCEDYVVVARPITPGTTGNRSFCSTADGIIRLTTETPVPASSLTVEVCKTWPPIQ